MMSGRIVDAVVEAAGNVKGMAYAWDGPKRQALGFNGGESGIPLPTRHRTCHQRP